jgi:hypothetical protein
MGSTPAIEQDIHMSLVQGSRKRLEFMVLAPEVRVTELEVSGKECAWPRESPSMNAENGAACPWLYRFLSVEEMIMARNSWSLLLL